MTKEVKRKRGNRSSGKVEERETEEAEQREACWGASNPGNRDRHLKWGLGKGRKGRWEKGAEDQWGERDRHCGEFERLSRYLFLALAPCKGDHSLQNRF